MPKGKPIKGYRKAGGGRKKTSQSIILVVRGARSKTLTRCTKKSTVPKLSAEEKQVLQRQIDKLSDVQLDQLFEFLGYNEHSMWCEVAIDLDVMESAQQRALAKFVDGLCCAAIENLQSKVNRLTAKQLEDVITFLTPLSLEQTIANQMEVTLDWHSVAASRLQELDELLEKILKR